MVIAVKHKTSDAVLREALAAYEAADNNTAKAALALGIARRTMYDRLQLAQDRGITLSSVRDPLEKARHEATHLRRQLAEVHRHNDTAETIRRTIYGLREIPLDPPKWLSSKTNIKGPGTPMMIWSDLHFGEVVKKEEVGGINEFNSKIAEKRMEILVNRSIGLIKHHMPNGVPGVVICFGGDMITGEIHQELADTNDAYLPETIRQLKNVLAAALVRMADEFGRVFVPCVVGNHGRMTMKPRMKGRVFTNYEWNIYTDLEDRLAHDKRIQFFIPGETDAYFTVEGHRFLLTHGDTMGVKGGDGIIGAIGPIMRGAFKVGRSEAQIGREFDTILMGHWHQYVSMRGLIVNNCLKGYDEFARLALRAPATPASQALWFVDKKWGINTQMEVYVQDPFRVINKSEPWVSIFKK